MEELKEDTFYNFWCKKGCQRNNIKATGNNNKCPKCNEEMKVLGTSTNITHVNTRESNLKT